MAVVAIWVPLLDKQPNGRRAVAIRQRRTDLLAEAKAPKRRGLGKSGLGFAKRVVQRLELLGSDQAEVAQRKMLQAGFRSKDAVVLFLFMQMKALEEALNAELFDRGSRPPVLSAHGRSLLDRARDLVDQADEFQRAAAGGEDLFGTLTLGVIPSATTTILPAALAQLRDRHPGMDLNDVSTKDAEATVRAVKGRVRDILQIRELIDIRTKLISSVSKSFH